MKRYLLALIWAGGLVIWMHASYGYTATVQPAKLEPYVMGYLTDLTGPARYMFAPSLEAYRAYVEELNARGGINGHPVKLVVEDHKNDVSRAAALAKRLILEDKVLALLCGGMSPNHRAILEEAKKTGVPIINALVTSLPTWPPNPEKLVFCTAWNMHPQLSPGHINQVICSVNAGGGKGTRISVFGFDSPGGRGGSDIVERVSKAEGMEVAYRGDAPPGTLDVSPWALKIAEAKTPFLHQDAGLQELIGLMPTLEKLGFDGSIIFMINSLESEVAKAMALSRGGIKNIYMVHRYPLSYKGVEKDIPEYGKIMQAVKKHGQEFPVGHLHVIGWVMGMITEKALNKVGWPTTPPTFLKAIETLEVDTRGLLGGPIRYTASDHHGTSWWRHYKWDFQKKEPVIFSDWREIRLENNKAIDAKGKVWLHF